MKIHMTRNATKTIQNRKIFWELNNVTLQNYLKVNTTRGVVMWERRSHTFLIATWLEDIRFYLDFLCATPDVAQMKINDKLSLA